MTTFICPVCGYDQLPRAPYETWPPPAGLAISPPYEDFLGMPSYAVCPQCGFEYGFDDNPGSGPGVSFEEYYKTWAAQGKPWFDIRGNVATPPKPVMERAPQKPLAQRQLLAKKGESAPQDAAEEG